MDTPKIGRRHPAWDPEMGEYGVFEWQGATPLFMACLDLETGDERRFKKASLRLSLSRRDPALIVAAEWKDWVTLAAPFHAAMAAVRDLPQDARPLLPAGSVPDAGLRLDLHLVDANTGRFAAERPMLLSRRFADALVAEARRQITEGIDAAAYTIAVDTFHEDLEDPAELFSTAIATDRPHALIW